MKKLFNDIDEEINDSSNEKDEREISLEERDFELKSKLINGTTPFKNLNIRPVTLSTLALLEQVQSSLVTGNPNADHVTDSLIFLWIQSAPRADVIKACSTKNIALIQEKAFELGDELEINDIEEVVKIVGDIMTASGKTKVVPVPKEEEGEEESKNK